MKIRARTAAGRNGGGICSLCEHDLEVKRRQEKPDSWVYCSNRRCDHHSKPHPTKQKLNVGKARA